MIESREVTPCSYIANFSPQLLQLVYAAALERSERVQTPHQRLGKDELWQGGSREAAHLDMRPQMVRLLLLVGKLPYTAPII